VEQVLKLLVLGATSVTASEDPQREYRVGEVDYLCTLFEGLKILLH
jgi:hypothetical protein